jgi:hypothetical protein
MVPNYMLPNVWVIIKQQNEGLRCFSSFSAEVLDDNPEIMVGIIMNGYDVKRRLRSNNAVEPNGNLKGRSCLLMNQREKVGEHS